MYFSGNEIRELSELDFVLTDQHLNVKSSKRMALSTLDLRSALYRLQTITCVAVL